MRAGFRFAALLVKYKQAWSAGVAGAHGPVDKSWTRHVAGAGIGVSYSSYVGYEGLYRLCARYPRF